VGNPDPVKEKDVVGRREMDPELEAPPEAVGSVVIALPPAGLVGVDADGATLELACAQTCWMMNSVSARSAPWQDCWMQDVVEFEKLDPDLQRHPKVDCLKLPHPAPFAPLVKQPSAHVPIVADGIGVVEACVAARTVAAGMARRQAANERSCIVKD